MDPFMAQIIMFGGNFAPRGWAYCDGQLLPISQNSALFSLLGTTYGGDGRTTFALPDFRGRVPIGEGSGAGLSTRPLGQKGGAENVQLSSSEMAAHNHQASLVAENAIGNQPNPTNNMLGATPTAKIYAAVAAGEDKAMAPAAVSLNNTGGGQPHYNMAPYNTVHYIIALQGVFPSRS